MTEYTIDIDKVAEADMYGILDYISNVLLEPNVAICILKEIKKVIVTLDSMPWRHAVIDEEPYRTLGIRKISVKNYIVFYIVDEPKKSVHILRILYNRREWKALL